MPREKSIINLKFSFMIIDNDGCFFFDDINGPYCTYIILIRLIHHSPFCHTNFVFLWVTTYYIRGHSANTWTKFYPISTTYTPQIDSCGHFTQCLLFGHVTKRGLSTDHLPTSSFQPKGLSIYDNGLLMMSQLHRFGCFFCYADI